MACSCRERFIPSLSHSPPIILLFFLSLSSSLVLSSSSSSSFSPANSTATLHARQEYIKFRRIRAQLKKLNKPSLKTIQSEDGDIIDCVPCHLQPAFDHPLLKAQTPLDPPEEIPKGYHNLSSSLDETLMQKWRMNGESCPDGTVPIRRTTEKDLLRASSIRRFGMKPARRVRRDSTSTSHEHAVGYVNEDQYYGARASLNVWSPRVTDPSEFSLSQIWIISGSFGNDLNTIEAGWQVSPQLYGDDSPRFFTYWTTDAYRATGCYNHFCSGFIQTNNKIAIGAAISPTSVLSGKQFDISLLIWKDPKHGHWWLQLGSGVVVGYWPSFLFTHLAQHANMVQFGGEIVNAQSASFHTSTQMGSGHFAGEGYHKSAYFRNLQVVDWDNGLIPASNLKLLADHPNCYDIQGGINSAWGNYFYYGGPGRNVKCP